MSIRTIQFKDMHIVGIRPHAGVIEITFDEAIIIKNMDAANEDTRWYGKGIIRIEGSDDDDFELPACPFDLTGADIRDNQMIYRDEVAIPFDFHGLVGLTLRFSEKNKTISIYGERMSLELDGHEKYIEHIKAG